MLESILWVTVSTATLIKWIDDSKKIIVDAKDGSSYIWKSIKGMF